METEGGDGRRCDPTLVYRSPSGSMGPPCDPFPSHSTPFSVTFGIQSTESLLGGLRREVHDQVQQALDDLSQTVDLGRAAHGSRRTLKRARALLKLARPSLTSDAYLRGTLRMRDAGRCVAPIRDADVLVETARSVCGQGQEVELDSAWAQLLEALQDERDAHFATAPGEDGPLARARALLRSVAIDWPEAGELDDRELLRTGLATSYESVRAHAERAFGESANARAYHELRKKAKDLRHQLEFLSPASPETLAPMAEGFHRLTDLLGDANDMAVLVRHASSAPSVARLQRSPLFLDLEERRQDLWEEAEALGARLLAEKTDEFVGRVEECWVESRP